MKYFLFRHDYEQYFLAQDPQPSSEIFEKNEPISEERKSNQTLTLTMLDKLIEGHFKSEVVLVLSFLLLLTFIRLFLSCCNSFEFYIGL